MKGQTMHIVSNKIETITPSKAAEYLKTNTANRSHRKEWINKLALMILNDQFELTHCGIAFREDGTLIDGQHRLMAIVQANRPVKMFVARGLNDSSMFGIDQGKIRDATDIASTFGIDVPKRVVAAANAMYFGFADFGDRVKLSRNRTHRQTLDFCQTHADALQFALSHVNRPVNVAIFHAVIARAWYTADHARLARFCEQLVSGVDNESSVARLRTYYFADPVNRSGSGAHRRALYVRVEYALVAFLANRQLVRLLDVDREMFPLPEEGAK
jgi:hypothetical protein